MPELLDHIAFLSQEIGPRPAGTEEEQQAALYITESLQKEAGLSAVIEDFNSGSSGEAPQAVCAFLTFAITILAIFLPVLAIPSFVVTLVTAILFALEAFDRPFILGRLSRGVSQNVVAKYEPEYSPETGGGRRRKIVLVANYDSGKVRPELKEPILNVLAPLQQASLYAMVFVPVFLLVRYLFFLHAEGAAAIVLNTITGIALAFVALPVLLSLVHHFAAYNEAANCNASGVAVLLETACRIGHGRVGASGAYGEGAGTATVYGEEAARASGLVPEGTQLVYEASQVQPPQAAPQTEEERLAAAKAAIAAMTGHPVKAWEGKSVAENLVQTKRRPNEAFAGSETATDGGAALQGGSQVPSDAARQDREGAVPYGGAQAGQAGQASQAAAPTPFAGAGPQGASQELETGNGPAGAGSGQDTVDALAGNASPAAEDASAVPEWFRKAQENAKRPKDGNIIPVQRSRYADALDAAAAESASFFDRADRSVDTGTEERLKQIRTEIMEVNAPQLTHEGEPQQTPTGEAPPSRVPPDVTAPVPGLEAQKSAPPMPQQDALGSPLGGDGSTVAMSPIPVDGLRSSSGQAVQAGQGYGQGAGEGGLPEGQALPRPSMASAIPALSVPEADNRPQQREPEAPGQPRGSIVLPDINVPAGASQQPATKGLLSQVPSIEAPQGSSAPGAVSGGLGQPAQGQPGGPHPDLRSLLPSLSGPIHVPGQPAHNAEPSIHNVEEYMQTPVSVSALTEATTTFAPINDELLHGRLSEDSYVDDVDDSAYDESFAEAEGYTGTGYMDMPQSRVRKLFGRLGFGKAKDKDEAAAHGRPSNGAHGSHKGGFSDDDWDDYDEGGYDDAQDGKGGYDDWRGGAFASTRATVDYEPADTVTEGFGPGMPGGYPLSATAEEMQQIYQFHRPGLDTEVWFVALGSELSNCGGMKAFLSEHEQDLRGSIIVNLRALGSGELCFIDKEGASKAEGTSSRMKRYVKKAAQSLGISIGSASIPWMNSATTIATKKGFQAMSVAGMSGSKPARFAQGDDVLENIDEGILEQNTDFVVELLKNI